MLLRAYFKKLKSDKSFRFRLERYFWIIMILPTIIWLHDSVLWVSLMSIYALVLTLAGAEESAKAAAAQDKSK